ncbi:MAG: transposase zinc-binding domain-containing protein [Planctomycetota bacterium]
MRSGPRDPPNPWIWWHTWQLLRRQTASPRRSSCVRRGPEPRRGETGVRHDRNEDVDGHQQVQGGHPARAARSRRARLHQVPEAASEPLRLFPEPAGGPQGEAWGRNAPRPRQWESIRTRCGLSASASVSGRARRSHVARNGTAATKHAPRRPVVPRTVEALPDCGRFHNGFARIRCPPCRGEHLLAFSCQTRNLCPSCRPKRAARFAGSASRSWPPCHTATSSSRSRARSAVSSSASGGGPACSLAAPTRPSASALRPVRKERTPSPASWPPSRPSARPATSTPAHAQPGGAERCGLRTPSQGSAMHAVHPDGVELRQTDHPAVAWLPGQQDAAGGRERHGVPEPVGP